MKKLLVVLAVAILLGSTGFTRAQCPDDPNDNGICDTFYVEVYPPDQASLPDTLFFVRVPIYVTHDVPDPYIDSIAAILLALCYEQSNPGKYCSLTYYWNNTDLYPSPSRGRSVFRHIIEWGDTLIHNWMMDLSQQGMGLEWDTRILDLDGTSHFWFAIFPTGSRDQRFGEGSRVLLATMTFKLEDTTTICLDTCFWPPASRANVFSRSDAVTYLPRHNLPYCVSIEFSERGDANGDGEITVIDALYMLNYLFRQGPPPVSFEAGDANCDGDHGALDVVYLINYLFRCGPHPGCL
jgi:hypothetical protein